MLGSEDGDEGSEPESVASGTMSQTGDFEDLAAANRFIRRLRRESLASARERGAMRAELDELKKRLPPLAPVEPMDGDETPAKPKMRAPRSRSMMMMGATRRSLWICYGHTYSGMKMAVGRHHPSLITSTISTSLTLRN